MPQILTISLTKNGLIKEKSRYNKDIEIKLDDFNEKMSELKSDYSLKETEFKNHKTKIKQLQSEIETLKREYDEAKEGLNEIKVNPFCFCFRTLHSFGLKYPYVTYDFNF